MQERIFSRADGEVFVKMDVIHEQHGEDGRGGRARTWPVTRLRALTGSRFQAEEDGMEAWRDGERDAGMEGWMTPWAVARQPSLSMGFSRQEHWCG